MSEKEFTHPGTTFLDFLDTLIDASARRNRRVKRRSERWWGNLWIDVRLYFRLLFLSLFKSKNSQGPFKGRRIFFIAIFIPIWTTSQLIHWFFFFLDEFIHPEYRQQNIEKPLFIIGNFRCGSTFLQRLLAKDRANFASFRMWEIFLAPSIIERSFFHLIVNIDHFFGGFLLKLAHFIDNSTMGNVDIHMVNFFAPEEDENMMLHTWTSSYIRYMFPYLDEIPEYLRFDESLPEKRKQQIMFYFERMVKRQLFAHPESKHYMSKSPAFTAKIDCLYKQFEDAQFVYLARNPYEVIASTTSWLSYAWQVFSNTPNKYVFTERIIPLVKHYFMDSLAKLEAHNPDSYLILRYDELIADPDAFVRNIYSNFGYKMTPEFEKILRKEADLGKQYQSNHAYKLEEMGFNRDEIYEEFKEIFERFGYEK